jgi:hypothetical protein
MEKTWASIRIPTQLKNTIRKYANKANMEEWRFIQQAVSSYIFFYTNPSRFVKERTKLEKVAWYLIKLISTVEAFKSNPSNEFQQLMGIIQQIETNLNLDLSLLRKAVMDYWTSWKGDRKNMQQYAAAINSAMKITTIETIEKTLGE